MLNYTKRYKNLPFQKVRGSYIALNTCVGKVIYRVILKYTGVGEDWCS